MDSQTPEFVAAKKKFHREGLGLYRVLGVRGSTGYYVEHVKGEEAYLRGGKHHPDGRVTGEWLPGGECVPMKDEADFDAALQAYNAALQAAKVLKAKHEKQWAEHDRQYALLPTRWKLPVPRS